MNDPHKFGTAFGSDHALEQSTVVEPFGLGIVGPPIDE
jgi:hypothetical protein